MTLKPCSESPQDVIDFLHEEAAAHQHFVDILRNTETDAMLAARYRYAAAMVEAHLKLLTDLDKLAKEFDGADFMLCPGEVSAHIRRIMDENAPD